MRLIEGGCQQGLKCRTATRLRADLAARQALRAQGVGETFSFCQGGQNVLAAPRGQGENLNHGLRFNCLRPARNSPVGHPIPG